MEKKSFMLTLVKQKTKFVRAIGWRVGLITLRTPHLGAANPESFWQSLKDFSNKFGPYEHDRPNVGSSVFGRLSKKSYWYAQIGLVLSCCSCLKRTLSHTFSRWGNLVFSGGLLFHWHIRYPWQCSLLLDPFAAGDKVPNPNALVQPDTYNETGVEKTKHGTRQYNRFRGV
jgi:hypothetical protein